MRIRWETAHVRPDDGDDGLRAGVPNARDVLDHLGGFFFIGFHEIVNVVVEPLDVGVQLVHMVQQDPHHSFLKIRYDTVEIIDDLLLCSLQVMRYELCYKMYL